MIGGRGPSRSLLGRIGGLSVHLLTVFVTLQVLPGQGDVVM